MTELAVVFAVNVVGSFFKKVVAPKWGKTGVQVLVFVAAVLGALYVKHAQDLPSLKALVTETLAVFSLSVAFYEVILSRFSLFKRSETPFVPEG